MKMKMILILSLIIFQTLRRKQPCKIATIRREIAVGCPQASYVMLRVQREVNSRLGHWGSGLEG